MLAHLLVRRRGYFVFGCAAITVLFGAALPRLTADHDPRAFHPQGSPLVALTRHAEKVFGADDSIRRLPEHIHANLRLRAARSKRSMEAEVRAILIEACSDVSARTEPEDVQDWVTALYANQPPKDVTGEFIAERRRDAQRE